MNYRLKFTRSQRKAWNNLQKAIDDCEKKGIKFAYDEQETLYGFNAKKVDEVLFREDSAEDTHKVPLDELPNIQLGCIILCSEDDSFLTTFK